MKYTRKFLPVILYFYVMKEKLLCWLLLLSLSLSLHAQEFNLGFEDWDLATLIPDSATYMAYPEMHKVENPVKGRPLGWGTPVAGSTRTTDAHSGNYAWVISEWYSGISGAGILGGTSQLYLPGDEVKVALPERLYGISGHYKYIPDSDSIINPFLEIRTYHLEEGGAMSLQSGDTIIFSPASAYTIFTLPVIYPDTLLPVDSVSIRFIAGGELPTPNPYTHFLYLDDLVFHFSPLSMQKDAGISGSRILICPNPATDKIKLEYESNTIIEKVTLQDISGRTTRKFRNDSRILDISGVPAGTYLLRVQVKDGMITEKIVINNRID